MENQIIEIDPKNPIIHAAAIQAAATLIASMKGQDQPSLEDLAKRTAAVAKLILAVVD